MKEIILTKGYVALVDDEDYEWLNQWKWHASINKSGIIYARRTEYPSKKCILMHRFIMKINERNIFVDHHNRDGLNNQKSNLRIATPGQNNRNSKKQSNNNCYYKGVSQDKRNGNKIWIANATYNGKHLYLGAYSTPEQAARVHDKEAKELFGEFAYLNFPD